MQKIRVVKSSGCGAALVCIVLLLFGCEPATDDGSIEAVRNRSELVVLTRNAPTTYYLERDEYAGPEHDMMQAFAASLGVKAHFIIYQSLEKLMDDLATGKGDVAAAGLTLTDARKRRFLYGPPYQKVRQQVVCRRNGRRAHNITELTQVQLAVVAHSSYVARLKALQAEHRELTWSTSQEDTETLLEQVWNREIDCTVADSNIVAVNRRYHPELVVTTAITPEEPLVWYLPPNSHSLRRAMEKWFKHYRTAGQLARTLDRYYGYVKRFDYVDTRRFLRRVKHRLPQYRKWFREAGAKCGIRWTLLAAQAYQESHWLPRASSPTGVRGIMMLTQPTAQELGVENRLDPKQSIFGGARYLRQIRARLPEEVAEPDRTWIALAAYNIGASHMRDARKLAESLQKNPNQWAALKNVLPLLSEKKYYSGLDFGYARGEEAVRYVNRIRNFEDLMVQRLDTER